jgi:hypothetical protein
MNGRKKSRANKENKHNIKYKTMHIEEKVKKKGRLERKKVKRIT